MSRRSTRLRRLLRYALTPDPHAHSIYTQTRAEYQAEIEAQRTDRRMTRCGEAMLERLTDPRWRDRRELVGAERRERLAGRRRVMRRSASWEKYITALRELVE